METAFPKRQSAGMVGRGTMASVLRTQTLQPTHSSVPSVLRLPARMGGQGWVLSWDSICQ